MSVDEHMDNLLKVMQNRGHRVIDCYCTYRPGEPFIRHRWFLYIHVQFIESKFWFSGTFPYSYYTALRWANELPDLTEGGKL